MTPIKPEDRTKVIVLLAAVALVFGYGLFNLFGPKNSGSAVASTNAAAPPPAANGAPAAAPPANTQVAASAPTERAPGAASAPAEIVPPEITQTTAGSSPVIVTPELPRVRPDLESDPFVPLPPPVVVAPAAPASKPSTVIVRDVPSGPRSAPPAFVPEAKTLPRAQVPTGQAPMVPPPVVLAPRAGAISPAPVVPAKPLQLVGVVWGARPVAMIRVGERQYYARQGERIADYRVVALGMEEVTLRGDKQARFVLRVGDPPLGGAPGGSLPAGAAGATSFSHPALHPAPPRPAAQPAFRSLRPSGAAASVAAATVTESGPAAPLQDALVPPVNVPAPPVLPHWNDVPAAPATNPAPAEPTPPVAAAAPATEIPAPAAPSKPVPDAPQPAPATVPPALPRVAEPEEGGDGA